MGGNIGSEKGKFAESWQREWREEDDVRADNEHVGRKLPLLTAVLRLKEHAIRRESRNRRAADPKLPFNLANSHDTPDLHPIIEVDSEYDSMEDGVTEDDVTRPADEIRSTISGQGGSAFPTPSPDNAPDDRRFTGISFDSNSKASCFS
ncbi:hypothetical protein V8E54_011874 [Elaphomyces granulatus]